MMPFRALIGFIYILGGYSYPKPPWELLCYIDTGRYIEERIDMEERISGPNG
jgi:hypothetical protein